MTPAQQQTDQSDTVESPSDNEPGAQKIGVHYDTQLPKLPWSRRIQIPMIAVLCPVLSEEPLDHFRFKQYTLYSARVH